jgi:RNA polymerase sigma factor (sigma-70 family)
MTIGMAGSTRSGKVGIHTGHRPGSERLDSTGILELGKGAGRRPAAASDSTINELVTAAAASDERAWEELVHRYQPIISSVCRRYRLRPEEGDDVSQGVWLKVTTHLPDLREPRALPGWIKTTASRLALATVKSRRQLMPSESATRGRDSAALVVVDEQPDAEQWVLTDERRAAVRNGLAELSAGHRALLTMLVAEPPISYRQISEQLGLPMGGIGPTRARLLRKLAATAAVRDIVEAYAGAA